MSNTTNCNECHGRGVSGLIYTSRCKVCLGCGQVPNAKSVTSAISSLAECYDFAPIVDLARILGCTPAAVTDGIMREMDIGAIVGNCDCTQLALGD